MIAQREAELRRRVPQGGVDAERIGGEKKGVRVAVYASQHRTRGRYRTN